MFSLGWVHANVNCIWTYVDTWPIESYLSAFTITLQIMHRFEPLAGV